MKVEVDVLGSCPLQAENCGTGSVHIFFFFLKLHNEANTQRNPSVHITLSTSLTLTIALKRSYERASARSAVPLHGGNCFRKKCALHNHAPYVYMWLQIK